MRGASRALRSPDATVDMRLTDQRSSRKLRRKATPIRFRLQVHWPGVALPAAQPPRHSAN